MSKFNKKELNQLSGIAGVLEDFNNIYLEMTAMQMRVFIVVARRGPVTGKDIATTLKISGPNVSRCVAMLSDVVIPNRKTPSLNIVQLKNDSLDRRVKYVELTELGEEFVRALIAHF
tara:strand:- start:402 stop:752 length:351 start_codon:yes stop_codon:yes gene_type:complete